MNIKTQNPDDKVDVIEIDCKSLNFKTRLTNQGRFGNRFEKMNMCEISFEDSRDLIFFTEALLNAIKRSEMYQDRYLFQNIDKELEMYLK